MFASKPKFDSSHLSLTEGGGSSGLCQRGGEGRGGSKEGGKDDSKFHDFKG